jgi:hypothetical protein
MIREVLTQQVLTSIKTTFHITTTIRVLYYKTIHGNRCKIQPRPFSFQSAILITGTETSVPVGA